MENLTQGWAHFGPSFQNQGTFFDFQKNAGKPSPLSLYLRDCVKGWLDGVYFQHKYWSVMNTFVVDLQVFFDWNNVLSCFRNGVLCLYQKSFFFCLCQMEIKRKLLLHLSGFLKLKFLKGFNNVINCDHLHRYALLCQISTTFNPEDIAPFLPNSS